MGCCDKRVKSLLERAAERRQQNSGVNVRDYRNSVIERFKNARRDKKTI